MTYQIVMEKEEGFEKEIAVINDGVVTRSTGAVVGTKEGCLLFIEVGELPDGVERIVVRIAE